MPRPHGIAIERLKKKIARLERELADATTRIAQQEQLITTLRAYKDKREGDDLFDPKLHSQDGAH